MPLQHWRSLLRAVTGAFRRTDHEEEFALYSDRVNFTTGRAVCLFAVALNIIWWYTDTIILSELQGIMSLWRWVTIGVAALGLVLIELGQRARLRSIAVHMCIAGLQVFQTYLHFSFCGTPEQPLVYTIYAVPFVGTLFLLTIRERILLLGVIFLAFFGGYFLPNPEYLWAPNTPSIFSFGTMCAVLTLAMGVQHTEVVRRNFTQRQELTQAVRAARERESAMEILATTDPLTGLYNRRQFFLLAAQEYDRCRRYHKLMAAVILDVDYFKQVNDRFGHPAGDAVLVAVAQLLRTTLRQGDVLGRIGGEEFGMLLPFSGLNEARLVAERVRSVIESHQFDFEGRLISITASLGLAVYQDTDREFDDLLRRADRALYMAKDAGRNKVEAI